MHQVSSRTMMATQEIKQKSGVDTLLVTREVECDTYFGVEYVPAMNDWVGVGVFGAMAGLDDFVLEPYKR